ncbi:uncharacterized protein [Procambarus clarkii]
MGSGWAVVVTVVGCASITGLLALLARYLGIWTWALAYLRAAREEKVQLCRSQRTSSTRSYLLDNDLDWIGLWPRTGSYKRFTNLDDPTSVPGDDPARAEAVDQPDLPPQPLRPAPAPPPRMGGWTESGEGSPSPASSIGMGIETPPEPSRPAPVLDRRDSSRSLTGRLSRRDSSKELLGSSQQGSPKRASTNPFRASWVPPDETSEESFAHNTFGVVTGSSPGAPPAATGSHSMEGFPDPRESRVQTERMSSQDSLAPATFPGPGSAWDTYASARPRGVEAETSKMALMNGDEERVAAGSSVLGDIFSNRGKTASSEVGKASYETFSFTALSSAGKTSQDNFSTLSTSGTESMLHDTSSFLDASSGAVKASYETFSTNLDNLGKTSYNSFTVGNYDVQKDNLNDSGGTTDDVFVDISEDDDICNQNTLAGNERETKIFENINRTNDKVLEGGSLNYAVNSFDKSIIEMNDTELRHDGNIAISTHMPQEVVSREETSMEAHVTSDPVGRSYEVPATPPNTATYPLSPRSPHIASRLAEVEARMRQLGAPTDRDVSQDWWPSEAPSSSAAREEGHEGGTGGRNPFVVHVGSGGGGGGGREEPGGLRSVEEEEEEEVFLLHDAVKEAPHRTHTTSASRRGEESAVECEEDASARRVREYIASLSARLRQIPDQEDVVRGSPDYMDTPPASATLPATPPRTAYDSSDTPSTSAAPHALYSSGRPAAAASSSSTPPTSVTLRNLYSSRRASADVSPAPPTVFTLSTSRRLSLDTPPSSAGLVTATPPNSASSQLTFGDTPPSSAGFSNTPPNSAGLAGSFEAGQTLKRAMSCDSVSSDTSVTLGELEDTCGQVTGHLTVHLIYDSDTADLEVVVVEGRDLVGPDPHAAVDSYVRVFLLPDKSTNMQTRVCRRTNNPTYRERFLFALEEEEPPLRALAFYMYASDKFTNTLIGEAQLRLTDVDLSTPCALVLPLTDMGQKGVGYGEIMFSLSYLPTAERLTVVVVKARSLHWTGEKTTADPFVKVYVLQNGKKVMKKKTSIKKDTRSPVFNEAMIFSVPAPALHNIQLRVTVAEYNSEGGQARSVGHVIVGTQATGKALSHWNQMMSALRKPIGMWHPLRR